MPAAQQMTDVSLLILPVEVQTRRIQMIDNLDVREFGFEVALLLLKTLARRHLARCHCLSCAIRPWYQSKVSCHHVLVTIELIDI